MKTFFIVITMLCFSLCVFAFSKIHTPILSIQKKGIKDLQVAPLMHKEVLDIKREVEWLKNKVVPVKIERQPAIIMDAPPVSFNSGFNK